MTVLQIRTTVADLSYLSLADRRAYPWAVSTGSGADSDTVIRFNSPSAAGLYASLMDDRDGTLRRWVALTEPEWQGVPVIHGWRHVTYFA